jgi:hypothetical protein
MGYLSYQRRYFLQIIIQDENELPNKHLEAGFLARIVNLLSSYSLNNYILRT